MKIRPDLISNLEGSSDGAQLALRNVAPRSGFELNLTPYGTSLVPSKPERDIRPLNGLGQAVKGGK